MMLIRRDSLRRLQNILLFTGFLMASATWAQIVVTPDPYLDLSTCRTYWESCDLDNNGAIERTVELGCFANKLAERKCNQGSYPTGNQNIVFVTIVCFEITYLNCTLAAQIPVNADDPTLYNICFKMDRTISQPADCRSGTLPAPSPVTATPTFATATSPPTSPPTMISPSAFIDADGQLTLQVCLQDLNAANGINGDELSFGEYSNFLQFLGQRVCFVPDGSYNIAREVTFNQHRCMSRIPCAGSSTIDLTALNLLDFCKRSYNFALSSSSCDGVNPRQPSPTKAPIPAAPSRMPSAEPSSIPSLKPSSSHAPSSEVEPRGSSATSWRRRTFGSMGAYALTVLLLAELLC